MLGNISIITRDRREGTEIHIQGSHLCAGVRADHIQKSLPESIKSR